MGDGATLVPGGAHFVSGGTTLARGDTCFGGGGTTPTRGGARFVGGGQTLVCGGTRFVGGGATPRLASIIVRRWRCAVQLGPQWGSVTKGLIQSALHNRARCKGGGGLGQITIQLAWFKVRVFSGSGFVAGLALHTQTFNQAGG